MNIKYQFHLQRTTSHFLTQPSVLYLTELLQYTILNALLYNSDIALLHIFISHIGTLPSYLRI